MERVGEVRMVHIAVPELSPGQVVQVTVRDGVPMRYRKAGGLEGKIVISDNFDEPLPENGALLLNQVFPDAQAFL
jgi:hypothetical protein